MHSHIKLVRLRLICAVSDHLLENAIVLLEVKDDGDSALVEKLLGDVSPEEPLPSRDQHLLCTCHGDDFVASCYVPRKVSQTILNADFLDCTQGIEHWSTGRLVELYIVWINISDLDSFQGISPSETGYHISRKAPCVRDVQSTRVAS
jgi:hypothetical protein